MEPNNGNASPAYTEADMDALVRALAFVAKKHAGQRRKGKTSPPYINHLISVTEILWQGGVRDTETLLAALLHDSIEDTATTEEEVAAMFSAEVASLVMEVTDDKTLPKAERKRLQVETAPHKSPRAKLIKLADKIHNVSEIGHDPPRHWSRERRRQYVRWAERVIAGVRGTHPALEDRFDEVLRAAKQALK